MKKLICAITCLSLISVGCGKDFSSHSSSTPPLVAANINSAGCLNLEKLISIIYGSKLEQHAVSTTVDLYFSSKKQMRENFIDTLVLGLFAYTRGPTRDLNDFLGVTQTQCEEIHLQSEDYRILSAAENRLEFSQEDGLDYVVEFLPPATVQLTRIYSVSDYNCGSDNVGIEIKIMKRIHFATNGVPLPESETLSAGLVKYLTNLPIESPALSELQSMASEDRATIELNSQQLNALTHLDVPQSILQCTPDSI